MERHKYAVDLLTDKITKLQAKKGSDNDINHALDCLISQIHESIKELQKDNFIIEECSQFLK